MADLTNVVSYKPITPHFTSTLLTRSAANYVTVVKQFEVETNPRYQSGHDNNPANGIETYCNIFLWDVTLAMMCEIPHWVKRDTGEKVGVGKGDELSANGVCNWLKSHGSDYNWVYCNTAKAKERATAGYPTVVTWKNIIGIGHVAVVLPGTDFVHIAQAGKSNFFDKDLTKGFGNASPLEFYTHD